VLCRCSVIKSDEERTRQVELSKAAGEKRRLCKETLLALRPGV